MEFWTCQVNTWHCKANNPAKYPRIYCKKYFKCKIYKGKEPAALIWVNIDNVTQNRMNKILWRTNFTRYIRTHTPKQTHMINNQKNSQLRIEYCVFIHCWTIDDRQGKVANEITEFFFFCVTNIHCENVRTNVISLILNRIFLTKIQTKRRKLKEAELIEWSEKNKNRIIVQRWTWENKPTEKYRNEKVQKSLTIDTASLFR